MRAIRGLYGEDVVYTGAGLAGEAIKAIWSDGSAPDFSGPGTTARMVSFEIEKAALPLPPRNGDTILRVATSELWRVNDVTRRDDVGAWLLVVEK